MFRLLLIVSAAVLLVTGNGFADDPVGPHFDIKQFVLTGNTLLPPAVVASVLDKHTGRQKDFGTLQEAIEDLEAAYKRRGYSMVTVILPEQELAGGIVTITVLEPRVKEVTITDNRHYSVDNILRALPTLKPGQPPNLPAISENLRAANENPGRKLTLQFKSAEQETDLTAHIKAVDHKPWRVSLTGDNTGSDTTGDYRTGVALQHFNLFDRDHVMALQYITSPDHAADVSVVSGSYRVPFYRWGDTLDLFGAYSDVDSGTTRVSGTNIAMSGKGLISGIRYNMMLPRFGAFEQKLTGGMDYRRYENDAVMLGEDVGNDVVAHPLSLAYGGVWASEAVTVDGYVGLLYNIPWGNLGRENDFEAVRSGATAHYLVLRYGLSALVRPGADWMLRIAGAGQYGEDRLIPGEQFGLGGSASIRGYEEREESWDAGFSGTAEIYTPDLARLMDINPVQVRLVGFYDGGYGYNKSPMAGELDDNSLCSAGIGVRLGIGDYFTFSLDWGHALKDSTTTRSGESRIHFNARLFY